MRAQSIFSGAFENSENSIIRNNVSILDPGTSLLFAENQSGYMEQKVAASLSVKKQLRL
jgi:hypothetical protein